MPVGSSYVNYQINSQIIKNLEITNIRWAFVRWFGIILSGNDGKENKEKQDGEIDEINLNNSNGITTSSKTVDDGMPFNEAIVSASGEISVKKGSIKSSKKGEVAESAESDKACCALFW